MLLQVCIEAYSEERVFEHAEKMKSWAETALEERTMEATFEKSLQELEKAVAQLEKGTLTLEESLTAFEEGIQWSRKCHKFLEKAERRIDVILKNTDGDHIQTEFNLGE